MLHQRAFDFERPDEMAGGLDHVVGAADEPEIAFGVLFGEIAGEVPRTGETLSVALFLIQIAPHHRRPARFERKLALDHRIGDDRDAASVVASNDRGLYARQRPTHRAGFDVH